MNRDNNNIIKQIVAVIFLATLFLGFIKNGSNLAVDQNIRN